MKNKLKIYLGDLDHFVEGNRYSLPLNIACIASYCKKLYGDEVEIKLFKHPKKLILELREAPPDILALSFYMWNSNLSLKIIEYCKTKSPSTITVIGGPSVARTTDKYKELLKDGSGLDIVVLDQGEKSFSNIIDAVLSNGIKKLFDNEIPGCASRLKNTKEAVRGNLVEDNENMLSLIPSPYLTGWLDPFLMLGFLPLLETTRGCPYTCTYCGWGDKFYCKLQVKDEEIVYEELSYIQKSSRTKELSINDSNFGIMGERDKRITLFMKEMHEKHGFPIVTDYASSKVKTSQSIEIMSILAEITGSFYFGLQTLTEDVLKKCARKNITLETVKELSAVAKEKNLSINVDLIFGLPGETSQSFFDTISELVSLRILQPSIYNLRLLPGTKLAEEEREKYQYKTRFRPFNNRYGEYELTPGKKPERIIEVEEIAYESEAFDKNDFMLARKFGFLSELLLAYGAMSETLIFLSTRGMNTAKIFEFILQKSNECPQMSKLFKEYERLVQKELFLNEEKLIENICGNDKEWNDLSLHRGNYFKINLGFVGYCLLENNATIKEVESLVFNCIKNKLTPDQLENYQAILKFDHNHRIISEKKESGLKKSDLKKEIRIEEKNDYLKWIKNDYKGNFKDYKFSAPVKYNYEIGKYEDFQKNIDELSNFSGFNFYERILIKRTPIGLRRLSKQTP